MASGALLHVARLGRPAAVQAGAIAPLGIQFNPVRRIGHHQPRLALAQQPRHGFSAGRVAAEHAMRPQQPQVARRGTPALSGRGGAALAFSSSSSASRPSISPGSKPVRLKIEIRLLEFLQLQREQFFVPIRPRHRTIHHQPERFYLRVGPLVAEDHRDLGDAKLARRL